MAVVSLAVCDICGNPIDIGSAITVVYGGILDHFKGGRAIVTFEDEQAAEPLHHHGDCHEATHVATVPPAGKEGIVH